MGNYFLSRESVQSPIGNMVFFTRKGTDRNKPQLVFLHGFLGDHTLWMDILEDIPSSYTIHLIDVFGHGLSDEWISPSFEKTTADLKKAIDQITVDTPFHLIGHSMGGYFVGALASLAIPQLLKSILINSSFLGDSDEKKIGREKLIEYITEEKFALFINRAVPLLFKDKKNKKLIDQAVSVALKTSVNTIKYASESMLSRTDLRPENTKNCYQILGGKDEVINFEKNKNAGILPDENILCLEDEGHMMICENPKAIAEMILTIV